MKAVKRNTNVTALIVKYIPATNSKGSRIKFTQTNTNKSIFVNFQSALNDTIDHAFMLLDLNNEVESYSVVVDNTQNKYYTIAVESAGNSFPDLLSNAFKA